MGGTCHLKKDHLFGFKWFSPNKNHPKTPSNICPLLAPSLSSHPAGPPSNSPPPSRRAPPYVAWCSSVSWTKSRKRHRKASVAFFFRAFDGFGEKPSFFFCWTKSLAFPPYASVLLCLALWFLLSGRLRLLVSSKAFGFAWKEATVCIWFSSKPLGFALKWILLILVWVFGSVLGEMFFVSVHSFFGNLICFSLECFVGWLFLHLWPA